MPIDVIPDQFLGVFVPRRLVVIPVGVFGISLEVQKVCPDRTIAILESSENDSILHLRHLGPDENGQCVGRSAAPRGIPGSSHTFTNRARFEDVRRTTGSHDDSLRAEHVEITGADIEPDSPGNSVSFCLVHQQMGYHDSVIDFSGSLAGRFGDNWFVTFAVNHDLPLAFAQISPGFRVLHDRQAPFLKLMHGGVNMSRNVVAQIFPH